MKCAYCSAEIKKGTGTMFVYNTGLIKYYCSSRCFKNDVQMKRKFNKKEAKEKKHDTQKQKA
ncbi:MAG: 50S ribosomal protein L24e [Candidatus Micrarchaeia archaeon]